MMAMLVKELQSLLDLCPDDDIVVLESAENEAITNIKIGTGTFRGFTYIESKGDSYDI